jgi:type IV pilus assembly protein PilQ
MKVSRWKVNAASAVAILLGVLQGGGIGPGYAQDDRAAVSDVLPTSKADVVNLVVEKTSIAQVLNAFSIQTGLSIVIGPEVEGSVNIRLNEVPWREALDVVLRPYGYGYQIIGKTIVVNKLERIKEVETVEQLSSRVFTLKYLDAGDIREVIESQLSPRGRLSVLTERGLKGWEFESATGGSNSSRGAAGAGKRQRLGNEQDFVKSKQFIVGDIPSVLTRISDILLQIDKRPRQVLIEAKFVEVNTDFLMDIGLEWGTGAQGAQQPGVSPQGVTGGSELYQVGAQQLGGGISPASFNAVTDGLASTQPFNAGLSLLFRRLSGFQFEALLHLLEEDVDSNLLSAPRILTLNNQEAAIIVGTKFPIISSDTSGQSATVSTTLEYYENIGIQLNVVPQVCDDDFVNMIVHPAVTDQIGTASARTGGEVGSGVLTEYPILSTREAETQILLRSGETIVLGGLLQDAESTTQLKVPFLGSIPVLGRVFRRDTTSTQKIDLLIFLTATIVDQGDHPVPLPGAVEEHAQPPAVPAEPLRTEPGPVAPPPAASTVPPETARTTPVETGADFESAGTVFDRLSERIAEAELRAQSMLGDLGPGPGVLVLSEATSPGMKP